MTGPQFHAPVISYIEVRGLTVNRSSWPVRARRCSLWPQNEARPTASYSQEPSYTGASCTHGEPI